MTSIEMVRGYCWCAAHYGAHFQRLDFGGDAVRRREVDSFPQSSPGIPISKSFNEVENSVNDHVGPFFFLERIGVGGGTATARTFDIRLVRIAAYFPTQKNEK